MRKNLQFPADLVTFTEEILNGTLNFLCSAKRKVLMKPHHIFTYKSYVSKDKQV